MKWQQKVTIMALSESQSKVIQRLFLFWTLVTPLNNKMFARWVRPNGTQTLETVMPGTLKALEHRNVIHWQEGQWNLAKLIGEPMENNCDHEVANNMCIKCGYRW